MIVVGGGGAEPVALSFRHIAACRRSGSRWPRKTSQRPGRAAAGRFRPRVPVPGPRLPRARRTSGGLEDRKSDGGRCRRARSLDLLIGSVGCPGQLDGHFHRLRQACHCCREVATDAAAKEQRMTVLIQGRDRRPGANAANSPRQASTGCWSSLTSEISPSVPHHPWRAMR